MSVRSTPDMSAPVRSVPADRWARTRTQRPARTDAYRYTRYLLFLVAAAAVDVPNFLDRGTSIRYAVLLIPIAGIVLIRMGSPSSVVRRFTFGDKVLFVI